MKGLLGAALGAALGLPMPGLSLVLAARRRPQAIPPKGYHKSTTWPRTAGNPAEPAPAVARTRQIARAVYRRVLKDAIADERRKERRGATFDLRLRQGKREKAGYYDGRPSVAAALAHNRAGRMQRQLNDDGDLVRLR